MPFYTFILCLQFDIFQFIVIYLVEIIQKYVACVKYTFKNMFWDLLFSRVAVCLCRFPTCTNIEYPLER